MSEVYVLIAQAVEVIGFCAVLVWTVREIRGAMCEVSGVKEGLAQERKDRLRDVMELRSDIKRLNAGLNLVNRILAKNGLG